MGQEIEKFQQEREELERQIAAVRAERRKIAIETKLIKSEIVFVRMQRIALECAASVLRLVMKYSK